MEKSDEKNDRGRFRRTEPDSGYRLDGQRRNIP
jgi:hypothetical protein